MKKVTVIVYSPTGGGRKIAEALSCSDFEAAVIDVTSAEKRFEFLKSPPDLSDTDILIPVVPVYAQSVSKSLLNFFKSIKYAGCVAVCVTYGTVNAGDAVTALAKVFLKKGAVILGGGEFVCCHSYSIGDLRYGKGRPNESDFFAAKQFCSIINKRFDDSQSVDIKTKRNPLSRLFAETRAKLSVKLPVLIQEKCVSCGNCKYTCPQGLIGDDFNITNSKKCTRCYACVHSCKNDARRAKVAGVVRRYLNKYADNSAKTKLY